MLNDCKEIWDAYPDADFLPTKCLLEDLNEREDWPWAGWNQSAGLTPSHLARQLRVFDVMPKQRRTFDSGRPTRGYERSSFESAWRDYGLMPEVCVVPKRKGMAVTDVTCVTALGGLDAEADVASYICSAAFSEPVTAVTGVTRADQV
jgi:hypothetical protein